MNVVLANIDYLRHTSTEGQELQDGLQHAGWHLSGVGFDGLRDVQAIIDKYKPEKIFVQDCRDWLPTSSISFRKDIGFTNVDAIGGNRIPAFTVLKDAWGWLDLQSNLAYQIRAKGIFCYYRLEMIRRVAQWAVPYNLIRFYHTVDAQLIRSLYRPEHQRRAALVSGHLQPCYPLRQKVFDNAVQLGVDVLNHPGYGNVAQDTPHYLLVLASHKVHVATASQWGCAFRKIIESVACGATPITNLPPWDVLPEIDGALVRIPEDIQLSDLKAIIHQTAEAWNEEERWHWAEKAMKYYDWRVSGERHAAVMEACVRNSAKH